MKIEVEGFISEDWMVVSSGYNEIAILNDKGNVVCKLPSCLEDAQLEQIIALLNVTYKRGQRLGAAKARSQMILSGALDLTAEEV